MPRGTWSLAATPRGTVALLVIVTWHCGTFGHCHVALVVSRTWYTGTGGKNKRVLRTGGQFHGPHGAMSLVAMPRGTVALLFTVTWHQWSLPRGTLAQVAKISKFYQLVVSATSYYSTGGHATWDCHCWPLPCGTAGLVELAFNLLGTSENYQI